MSYQKNPSCEKRTPTKPTSKAPPVASEAWTWPNRSVSLVAEGAWPPWVGLEKKTTTGNFSQRYHEISKRSGRIFFKLCIVTLKGIFLNVFRLNHVILDIQLLVFGGGLRLYEIKATMAVLNTSTYPTKREKESVIDSKVPASRGHGTVPRRVLFRASIVSNV